MINKENCIVGKTYEFKDSEVEGYWQKGKLLGIVYGNYPFVVKTEDDDCPVCYQEIRELEPTVVTKYVHLYENNKLGNRLYDTQEIHDETYIAGKAIPVQITISR